MLAIAVSRIIKCKLFLIPILGLLFTACTSGDSSFQDENISDETDNFGESQVLSVNIISSGPDSRTGEDTKNKGSNGPQYENGAGAENYIRKVRFYFFTASGDAAMVRFSTDSDSGEKGDGARYLSYYDWFPTTADEETTDPEGNIEKILKANIVIYNNQKDKKPFYIVAVLNPSNNMPDENLSLEELDAIACGCNVNELSQGTESNGKFEMSNSVHVNQEGAVIEALPLEGHLCNNEKEALDNPVEIYVERTMARLDLSVALEALDSHPGVYDTGVSYSEIDDYAGDKPQHDGTDGKIYVKFLGWNVTATPDRSRLMKRVDNGWSESLFGWSDEPWNNPHYFRSYWAINPSGVKYIYGNFGQALDGTKYNPSDENAANANTYFGTATNKATVYLQENAAKNENSNGMQEPYDNTKVIIAAQLVLSDGETPVTMAEWGLNYYTIKGVKTVFAQNLDLYRRTGTEGSYQYKKIKPDDIEFITAGKQFPEIKTPAVNGGAPENVSEDNKGRCYVYPKLVDDGSTWTQGEGDEAMLFNSYEAADDVVRRMGRVKIWNNGYTYYYFNIAHLGNKGFPGEYGVVRNHIYNVTINALSGLGTPVYDPNETIYPEKPDRDNSMIAASIYILKWRLAKKTFQLSW